MMNQQHYQGIPVTPVEAMILAKLDRLESKMALILASKDQAGEALEEPVEEAGDDEPPADFIRQPGNAHGPAMVQPRSRGDELHYEALHRIGIKGGLLYIPCNQEIPQCNPNKKTSPPTNTLDLPIIIKINTWKLKPNSQNKIYGGVGTDDAQSVGTVASEESREIIRQFSIPGTSSGPAAQHPVLTRDASTHSVHSDGSASTHGYYFINHEYCSQTALQLFEHHEQQSRGHL
ncbi:hypothetical protein BDC45DRAFT_583411 [Circinella umbellata]|nr:hypothetical protein BDC45DRAFT_583411 [Circinella umbellata]